MTREVFEARLLQMSIERDAINAEIAGMTCENNFRAALGHDLTHDESELFGQADKLRALQGDIKKLLEEYSKGEPYPPTTPDHLASAKEIIRGLGSLMHVSDSGFCQIGWPGVDVKKAGVVRAALEILLRPAAGDKPDLVPPMDLDARINYLVQIGCQFKSDGAGTICAERSNASISLSCIRDADEAKWKEYLGYFTRDLEGAGE